MVFPCAIDLIFGTHKIAFFSLEEGVVQYSTPVPNINEAE